ncbi:MAG: hypothetical protein JO126_09165 [Alphaproteobacteria bacterium]|nr:hypothetical protein [Alphaproteobacteria bacterium]
MAEGGLIIGLCFPQQQDALTSATVTFVEDFCEQGRNAIVVNLSEADGLTLLSRHLQSGAVDFCYGVQGIGSNLKVGDVNLWTASRTPFVGVHFDHPCHNPLNHFSESAFVGNLYYFDSFRAARQNYIGGPQLSGTIAPDFFKRMPGITPETGADVAKRPIKFLYVKSGTDIRRVTDDVNNIHESVRDAIWQQIDYARQHPNIELCDLVAQVFQDVGYDRTVYDRQFWGIVQIMDLYIRARRSVDFVEWLKGQEGAVIVGDGWDFIDRTNARAVFRPTLPIEEAYALFADTQFICNTNPHGADIIHERVVKGLLNGCAVLTDTNSWWDARYSDLQALKRFDWSAGWQDRVQAHINEAAFSPELCRQALERAWRDFTSRKSYGAIAAFAQQVRQRAVSGT